jgi:hypothetical protein
VPLILVEPDAELARIVQYEAAGCAVMEVLSLPMEEWGVLLRERTAGFVPVVLPSKATAARVALGEAGALVVLQIGSITQPLMEQLPTSREHLVGIASRWPEFLKIAQTMLIATGFSADGLILRDAREAGWMSGLEEASGVLCDSLTASMLADGVRRVVFPLLTEKSLEELREHGRAGSVETQGRV